MTIAGQHLASEERSEPRAPVLYRTRLIAADGTDYPATLVNFSPGGFMARCDIDHMIGDGIAVVLPIVGRVAAEVRWVLGGRIGCQLGRPIDLSDYHMLLQALPRG